MDNHTKRLLNTGAYLWGPWIGIIGLICSIVCIVTADKDKNMKYHGIQGLGYGIAIFIVFAIVASIFGGYGFGFDFVGGWYRYGTIFTILNILVLVYSIWLASQVYKHKKIKIPVVYAIVKGLIK